MKISVIIVPEFSEAQTRRQELRPVVNVIETFFLRHQNSAQINYESLSLSLPNRVHSLRLRLLGPML